MEKDILQRITEECTGYSKRQMAIAKYVSENSEIVAFMTAQMLSEAAGVSASSVDRQPGIGEAGLLRNTEPASPVYAPK